MRLSGHSGREECRETLNPRYYIILLHTPFILLREKERNILSGTKLLRSMNACGERKEGREEQSAVVVRADNRPRGREGVKKGKRQAVFIPPGKKVNA